MEFYDSIIMMKRLLRQGWFQTRVPIGEIESLADHSFSTAIISFVLTLEENDLRKGVLKSLDPYKAALIALFHDFHEAQYFDFDKSLYQLGLDNRRIKEFLEDVERKAKAKLLLSFPESCHSEIIPLLLADDNSEEYLIAKLADYVEIMQQAKVYFDNGWLNSKQYSDFCSRGKKFLQEQEERFLVIKKYFSDQL